MTFSHIFWISLSCLGGQASLDTSDLCVLLLRLPKELLVSHCVILDDYYYLIFIQSYKNIALHSKHKHRQVPYSKELTNLEGPSLV